MKIIGFRCIQRYDSTGEYFIEGVMTELRFDFLNREILLSQNYFLLQSCAKFFFSCQKLIFLTKQI